MYTSLQSQFPDVRRAPKGGRRAGRGGTAALIRGAAPAVIRECLSGKPGGFAAREILDQVAEFAAYAGANPLGTALGEGVRGQGLGLHRDEAGCFRRCRDNAVLAALRLTDGDIESLAASLGYPGPEALVDAIGRLPAAPDDPAA